MGRRGLCWGMLPLVGVIAVAPPLASGQDIGSDDDTAEGAGAIDEAQELAVVDAQPRSEWGVGLRSNVMIVPRGLLELFWEEVPGGLAKPGFGLEVTRRKGDLEIRFGLEYDSLSPSDGFFREKGGGDDAGNVSSKTDFVDFEGFGWVTLDAAFVFHRVIAPQFALRYGAGFGLGILKGEVRQTDSICSSDDIQNDCRENPNGAQVNDPADLPPVFPVVDLLAGLQYRPLDKLAINLEAGLRTAFYVGLGANYFF